MPSTQGTAALLGASADAAPHVEEHEQQAGQLRRHLPPSHCRLQPRHLPLASRPRPHCQVIFRLLLELALVEGHQTWPILKGVAFVCG